MKLFSKLLLILALVFSVSCDSDNKSNSTNDSPQQGDNNGQPDSKPKSLWFDAEANFERFSYKDSISYYLDKTKETGFTSIVVDVKPIYGKVLYKKTSLPELTKVNDFERTIDWDYLQFFIDEAKKRDLSVTVSTNIFGVGHSSSREGLVYETTEWDGKTAIQYLPDGTMLDTKDNPNIVSAFLNPALPEVQRFALDFINEIVANYEVDAYALDYARFSGIETDFSEASKELFEEYIDEEVENFPEDIFYYENNERIFGKHAKKWFEFRSLIIHDFVKKAKEEIKAINPEVRLEYWAASWYGAKYHEGQNWASKAYDPSLEYDWATPEYKKTGFAEHLDAFIIGTYLTNIYGMDDPESIEFGLERGKRLLKNDTEMHGSIYALNHQDNIEDATYVCLRDSDGLMVFDIVQVIKFNQWDAIKRGIERSGF